MLPYFGVITLLCSILIRAQQYQGENITNSLPTVNGAPLCFFRIRDPVDPANNLTLLNYYSLQANGSRIVESEVRRAVIAIHGTGGDGWNYESHLMYALSQQTQDPNVNRSTVAMLSPVFANDQAKNQAYPYSDTNGSTSSALVWEDVTWSDGANSIYPTDASPTSTFTVLDQLVQYFDNTTLFPNLKQIVVAGHSRGAQTVNRYAAIGNPQTHAQVSYYIANPNGYVWMSPDRPLSTANCPTFDNYGDGLSNFTQYPMTYGVDLVAAGRAAVLANYQKKQIAYARALQDMGDASTSCGPYSTGNNRNDRFFNFIKAFPPTCANASAVTCQTVDYVNATHSDVEMFSSLAGQARLFLDNFYGNGTRAYDFGYPRIQAGDDPYPDPKLAQRRDLSRFLPKV